MGESKDYMTLPEQNGSVNIAKDVIAAVAVDAVREVEGVSGRRASGACASASARITS